MSKTLNLADRLLAMGRNLHDLGRHHDALQILGRLAGLGDLPVPVAEETQVRLAEIQLGRHKYTQARRHLTAALTHRPDSARYYYLLASALAADEKCDRQRAAEHYRMSLQFDPDQPRCLGEFGLLALRLGQTEEGLASLRRAVELAPDDPHAAGKLATGLRQIDRVEEARGVLRAALFRNPRDPRFRRLWNDFQFDQLREEQETARQNENAQGEGEAGPILLPFVRPAPETISMRPGRRKLVRRDKASPGVRPPTTRPARLPDQRHA